MHIFNGYIGNPEPKGRIFMSKKTPRIYSPVSTLRQMTLVNTQKRAEKAVFRYLGHGGSVHEVTYGDFHYKCEKLIAAFKKRGFTGKRVALIGETCPEWLEAFCAVISSDNVVIPFDKELVLDEIKGFMEVSRADAIVLSPKYAKKYADLKAAGVFDNLDYILPVSLDELGEVPDADDRVIPLDDFIADAEPENILPSEIMRARARGDMSIMLFTSGTTGSSKCVMLSERNLVSCANAACESVNFSEDDVTLSVLPIHHTYELAILIAQMLYGTTICINDNLKHVLKNLKLFKPTALTLVPLFVTTFNKKIWDEVKKKGKTNQLKLAMRASDTLRYVGLDMRRKLFSDILEAFGGRLEKIICGGAAMQPELMKIFDSIGIELCEGYGITECSPLIAVNPYYKRKYGSVGPAVPCCEVKIDGESTDASGHVIGEILVKGENVMIGYYDNPEANEAAFTDDGWFRTGDVGYMDSDGYIFITGRKKTVIVLNNGKNVFPEEIEEYLSGIDSICECVVIGRDKGDGEILLTAVIYPDFAAYLADEPIDRIAEDIKKQVLDMNRKLPSFKQIRNIEIRKTEFEKTTSKKIKRFLVK